MKKNYLAAIALTFLFAVPVSVLAQNTEPCNTDLGGASDPNFLRFNINGTTLEHETLSPQTSYYNNYPQDGNTTAVLAAGESYDIFTFTSSEAAIGLWVDYNHDNVFDESEFTLLVNSMTAQNTTSFPVRADAIGGNTKIRLRTRAFGSTMTGLNACTSFGSGETRDYTVSILPIQTVCTTDLGGGVDPVFLTFNINTTTLQHDTFFQQLEYYNEYPQDGNTTAVLGAGVEYGIYTFTSSEAVIGLWVDYNHNNEFEETEYTLLVNSMTTQNTTNFVIPADAPLGNTKIRLRSRAYGSSITGSNSCTSFGSGETRDYTVTISPALSTTKYTGSKKLNIYPNPAEDIAVVGSSQDIKEVALYGISGNRIAVSSSNQIDVSACASGIYIVKATYFDGQTLYEKVIKK